MMLVAMFEIDTRRLRLRMLATKYTHASLLCAQNSFMPSRLFLINKMTIEKGRMTRDDESRGRGKVGGLA